MNILQVSTATTILIGPLVGLDGVTPVTTGITAGDVLLWKSGGGSMSAKTEASAPTHLTSGFWTCALNATDTGTQGNLAVCVVDAATLPYRTNFTIVQVSCYNALVNATGNGLRADVQTMGSAVIVAGSIANDALTAAKFASDVGTEIATAVGGIVCETEGSYTLKQIQSLLLAFSLGQTTTGGAVMRTPNGVAARATMTYNGSNERTGATLAPSA